LKYRDKNYNDFVFSEWEVKDFLDCFNHEFYHSHIFRKFGLESEVTFEIERKQEGNILYFRADGKCIAECPIKYNHPKYYPKFVLIGLIQFIYDVFYDIRKFNFFKNLFFRLKVFYKAFRCFNPKNN